MRGMGSAITMDWKHIKRTEESIRKRPQEQVGTKEMMSVTC